MARVTAIRWGVKQSFRNYVEGAGGQIVVSGDASREDDGGFCFPAAEEGLTITGSGPEGSAAFGGEVNFSAHGGMLKVSLADLRLEVRDGTAVISVAETGRKDRRLDLAVLDLAAAEPDTVGDLAIPAKMSRDGWLVLGDHYPQGTPIDPVRLVLAD